MLDRIVNNRKNKGEVFFPVNDNNNNKKEDKK